MVTGLVGAGPSADANTSQWLISRKDHRITEGEFRQGRHEFNCVSFFWDRLLLVDDFQVFWLDVSDAPREPLFAKLFLLLLRRRLLRTGRG